MTPSFASTKRCDLLLLSGLPSFDGGLDFEDMEEIEVGLESSLMGW